MVSPAKLNLYLEILDKRPDGYHNIITLFERVSLADEILIRESEGDSITLESDSQDIPLDRRNLVYKAAAILRDGVGIRKGVSFQIKKRIPAGAGLGGGSSNAAAALIGLNWLWRLGLSRKKLWEYAAKLGSDVAFFISDASFAWGSSRGEKIQPLRRLNKKLWHIILVPDVTVSTQKIYQEFDRNADIRVCRPADRDYGGRTRRISQKGHFRIDKILFNRLEETTFKRYPMVKKLKEELIMQGLSHTLMSGSGGSVFGIVRSRKEGLRIAEHFHHRKGVKTFVVKTM